MAQQITSHILMVRPANFGYNPETAQNNAFQKKDTGVNPELIKEKAIQEFDVFVKVLRAAGIDVNVVEDSPKPVKTDAVFPNNWVSFHENGAVITYPMFSPIRRLERREAILDKIGERFTISQRYHLEESEDQDLFLEGTGSLILDRINKIAYACTSDRTNPQLVDKFCSFTGYQKVLFQSMDRGGIPVYHTNVMMTLGVSFVVICMESVSDPEQNQALRKLFKDHGKELIEISHEQMESFAGNMMQVKNQAESSFLVMSSQAFQSLREDQVRQIRKHTDILHSPLDTIEKYGGGSARCMIAEIFLPVKEEKSVAIDS